MKPYSDHASSDLFYLQICNDLKSIISKNHIIEGLEYYLEESEYDTMLCFLTSYFEDLISQTNLWNSFIYLHLKKYDKQLPFYNIEEYYEEEINSSDIQFLVWYFINAIQKDVFLHPDAKLIIELAQIIFDVFDKKWDYAPVNQELKKHYNIDNKSDDYYEVRQLMDKIIFQSYLFYPDTGLTLESETFDILNNSEYGQNTIMLLNENRDHSLHNFKTTLLALSSKEWAAALLGPNHRLHRDIKNMSNRISALFLYKGKNDKYLHLEHIASGLKFDLLKSSYDYESELNKIDTIFFVGIVKWQDEWWFSGISYTQPFNADQVLALKSDLPERSKVSFLQDQSIISEAIEKQRKQFLEFNNDSPIAFLPANQASTYIQSFFEYCQSKLSKNKKEQSEQRARKDGLFLKNDSLNYFEGDTRQGFVFFNPISGIELGFNINSAFAPNDEHVDPKDQESSIVEMLMSISASKELITYWSKNHNKLKNFKNNPILKAYQSDSDFLLRFWKKANYHTQPSTSLFGDPNTQRN